MTVHKAKTTAYSVSKGPIRRVSMPAGLQFGVLVQPQADVPDASEESRFNSYELACAALVTLKGVNLIDLVYDDRVISKLCLLTQAVTRKLIKKHLELGLGKPTEETIDHVLMELENENLIGPGTDSF